MNEEKQEGQRGKMVVGIHLSNRSYSGGLAWGVLITLVGVAVLLDHLGIINVDHLWRFWPLLLIVAGAAHLFAREHRFWGILLIVAGVLVQLNQLGVAHFGWAEFWPVILIAVGVLIMWGSLESRNRTSAPGPHTGDPQSTVSRAGRQFYQRLWEPNTGDPRTTVSGVAIFSGLERRVSTRDFQGGKVDAIFGGIELDFTEADMQGEEATLEVNAIFGGVEIRVPYTWQVSYRGLPIFGGIDDKTKLRRPVETPDAKHKVLHITGTVMFGGVEIKN